MQKFALFEKVVSLASQIVTFESIMSTWFW